ERLAGNDGKLAGAAAQRPDLCRRQALLQTDLRDLICVQRWKGKLPVEIRVLVAGVQRPAQPSAKLDEVTAMRDGGVVLQFVVILIVVNRALRAASAVEGPQHIQRWLVADGNLVAAVADVLEARLVHHGRA